MKALTADEMDVILKDTVVFTRDNDPLWATRTGWRYTDIAEDGSYMEVSSQDAIRLWGPITLAWKGPDWAEEISLSTTKDLIENLNEIWENADRTTQDRMIEMLHDWYLKNKNNLKEKL